MDILSIKDEEELFEHVSQAVVDISDFQRVVISYFTDSPPYREIIGHKGIKKTDLERLKKAKMPRQKFLKYFEKSIKIGNQSCYIPQSLKSILDKDAIANGEKTYPKQEGRWNREDNLLVAMKDNRGRMIGIISVNPRLRGKGYLVVFIDGKLKNKDLPRSRSQIIQEVNQEIMNWTKKGVSRKKWFGFRREQSLQFSL